MRRTLVAGLAVLWAVAGYLVLHTTLVLTLSPDRLHQILGDRAYEIFIAGGGFGLLFFLLVWAILWSPPVAVAALLAWLVLRPFRGSLGPRALRLTIAAACFGLTLLLHVALLDGWPGTVAGWLLQHDTEFAEGYKPWGFWRVRPGMTEHEVLDLAGPPLERYPIEGSPRDRGWHWSRSPHSNNYKMRGVIFRDGRVREKFSEFYWD